WFAPAFKTAQAVAVTGWQTQLGRCDDESYARLCELLAAADFRGQFGGSDHHVQLLAGSDDVATPPASLAALAAELPGSEQTTWDAVAHVPSVEASQRLTEWLRTVLTGRAPQPPIEFVDGLAVRKTVLGADHVERSLAAATSLDMPFQRSEEHTSELQS